jgi:hypothetical protein
MQNYRRTLAATGSMRQPPIPGREMGVDNIRPEPRDQLSHLAGRQKIVERGNRADRFETGVDYRAAFKRSQQDTASLSAKFPDIPLGMKGAAVGQNQNAQSVTDHIKRPSNEKCRHTRYR